MKIICLMSTHYRWVQSLLYSGMRFGFGKNSAKFYVAIDSNPIQHHWFQLPKMII